MNAKDPTRLLDAAYRFGTDEPKWLEGICDVLEPYDLGSGFAMYTSDLGDAIAVRHDVNRTPLPSTTLEVMVRDLPPAFYRYIHAPMPLTHNVEFFGAAARALGITMPGPPHGFDAPAPDFAWAFAGGDRDVESALVVFHCKLGAKHSERDTRVLNCFAAHLGSALRLRSQIGSDAPSTDANAVEAVLSPDGRVLDARGEAKDEASRAPLLDAIRRSEKAKLRDATPEERLDVWTALVEGRWSIVETEERDGRRILLACRNDPRVSPLRALTPRERAVATYAALGHSLKYVAYELGIAVTTVDGNLKSSLRKLGLASRADLIQLFARTAPSSESPPSSSISEK